MRRFSELEDLGLAVAAMSDKGDGDCGLAGKSDTAAVLGTRAEVCHRCNIHASHLVTARQVHGARIALARQEDRGRGGA